MAGAQEKVGLGHDLRIVHGPQRPLLYAEADPILHALDPAGDRTPVEFGFVELDLFGESDIGRVGPHVFEVDEQAGALALEGRDLLADYHTVRREVEKYQPELAQRAEAVVLNKVDLIPDREVLAGVAAELVSRGRTVLRLSGATGEGVEELVNTMLNMLDEALRAEAES